jgi:hypothetical protein
MTIVCLLMGLAIAFSGLAMWFGRSTGRPVELPKVPTPNGYDQVLEGAREVEKNISGFTRVNLSTTDEATLQAIVDVARAGVKRGLPGLDLPFQVPLVLDLEEMFKVPMRDAGSIRGGLARALAAEGQLAKLQKKTDVSTRSAVDLIRLGDAMSHHVPMQSYLMSNAIEAIGLRLLRDVHAECSAAECRRLIAILEAIEAKRDPVSDVLQLEHRVMDFNLKKMGMAAQASMALSGMLTKQKRDVATTLESLEKRQDTTRRLVLAALALRAYRLEHDDFPAAPDALVPSYLKSIPIDVYTGKPLLYQKLGKDAQFYSTGPDRVDDHLEPVLGKRHVDTSKGDFAIDSF